jgi:hypothetical protein
MLLQALIKNFSTDNSSRNYLKWLGKLYDEMSKHKKDLL